MNLSPQTLLTIDRWFSPINRFALRFLTKVPSQARTDSVVMIKLMGMGSIIHLLSVCRKQHVDFSKVTLITFDSNREVCNLLGVPRCLFIRTKGFHKFFVDCWRIRNEVRRSRPGWIIDYERCSNAVSLFSLWLARAAAARCIRFNTLPKSYQSLNVNLFSFYEIIMEGVKVMPRTASERQVQLTPERHPGKIIININCSAYLLARRYPRDFFREVIACVHEQNPGAIIFLTGSMSERPYVQGLADELLAAGIGVQNVAGNWTLRKLEEELRTAMVFISGDSGPLHLATRIGAPTVAIWGPTQPGHFGYTNSKSLINLSLSLSCAPCFLHPESMPGIPCSGQITCLKELKPLSVAQAALKLMGQPARAPGLLTPAAAW